MLRVLMKLRRATLLRTAIFFSCRKEQIHYRAHSAARWPQPKRASPCSPTSQSLNTETTEDLNDLCVRFFLVREDTEATLV